jgi:hypothetical protein
LGSGEQQLKMQSITVNLAPKPVSDQDLHIFQDNYQRKDVGRRESNSLLHLVRHHTSDKFPFKPPHLLQSIENNRHSGRLDYQLAIPRIACRIL